MQKNNSITFLRLVTFLTLKKDIITVLNDLTPKKDSVTFL